MLFSICWSYELETKHGLFLDISQIDKINPNQCKVFFDGYSKDKSYMGTKVVNLELTYGSKNQFLFTYKPTFNQVRVFVNYESGTKNTTCVSDMITIEESPFRNTAVMTNCKEIKGDLSVEEFISNQRQSTEKKLELNQLATQK